MNKRCSRCREVKPIDDFFRSKRYPDGRKSECKICSKKKSEKMVVTCSEPDEQARKQREQRIISLENFYNQIPMKIQKMPAPIADRKLERNPNDNKLFK